MVQSYGDSFAYALGERKCGVRDLAAKDRLFSSAADLKAVGYRCCLGAIRDFG